MNSNWNPLIGVVLILLIIACVVGNVFVLSSILLERDLRARRQSYLIFSLALADLLVGLIVTPLKALDTLQGEWIFGVFICDVWICVDVLLCTASIWHLVAIALDRYWSVTNVSYAHNRTPLRIFSMLCVVWLGSLLISLPPALGLKDADSMRRVEEYRVCLISQQIIYQVVSTACAFYIPLCLIVMLYCRIMAAARSRFRRERDRRQLHLVSVSEGARDSTASSTVGSRLEVRHDDDDSTSSEQDEQTPINGVVIVLPVTPSIEENKKRPSSSLGSSVLHQSRRRRETPDAQRERRAWRTLAIITGSFIACWFPFFAIAVYRPMCDCYIPPWLSDLLSWLGYLNSALNPVIYTLFSPDFRGAFKRILKRICFLRYH